jgi:hypothetical protein
MAYYDRVAIGQDFGAVTTTSRQILADVLSALQVRKPHRAGLIFSQQSPNHQVTLLHEVTAEVATSLIWMLAIDWPAHCGWLLQELPSQRVAVVLHDLPRPLAAQVLTWMPPTHAAQALVFLDRFDTVVVELLAEIAQLPSGGPHAGPATALWLLETVEADPRRRHDMLMRAPLSDGTVHLVGQLPTKLVIDVLRGRSAVDAGWVMGRLVVLYPASTRDLLTQLGPDEAAPVLDQMETTAVVSALLQLPPHRSFDYLVSMTPDALAAALSAMPEPRLAAAHMAALEHTAPESWHVVRSRVPADLAAMAGPRWKVLSAALRSAAARTRQAMSEGRLGRAVRDEWTSARWLSSIGARSTADPSATATPVAEQQRPAAAEEPAAAAMNSDRPATPYRLQRNVAALTALGLAVILALVLAVRMTPTEYTIAGVRLAPTVAASSPAAPTDLPSTFPVTVELLSYDRDWREVCPALKPDADRGALRLYCNVKLAAGTGVDRWILQFPSESDARDSDPSNNTDVHDVSPERPWSGPHNRSGTYRTYRLDNKDAPAIWLKVDRFPIAVQLVGGPGLDAFEPLLKLLEQHGYRLQ